jgi:inorganic pyrophosphatase
MSIKTITAGKNIPDEVNVIIEIPAHSDPVKYEVCKDSGMMFVDRFMSTSMRYPCDYGYIPQTLGDDGDPLDALVITPYPLITGSVIACRPVGMLVMTDESGEDAKILMVPIDKVARRYSHIKNPEDFGEHVLGPIKHFFEHYKDLEPGKWVKVEDWLDAAAAKKEIEKCVKAHQ